MTTKTIRICDRCKQTDERMSAGTDYSWLRLQWCLGEGMDLCPTCIKSFVIWKENGDRDHGLE